MSNFGPTLQRIRNARQMSQVRLAIVADFDHSFVSRMEAGTRFPSRSCVEKLADVLHATETERYELLTSAGYHCDIVIEHDLLTLNAALQDERIDPAYRDSMRNTIRSLVALAQTERESGRERWYAPMREVS